VIYKVGDRVEVLVDDNQWAKSVVRGVAYYNGECSVYVSGSLGDETRFSVYGPANGGVRPDCMFQEVV
jgi:hypothetical protein